MALRVLERFRRPAAQVASAEPIPRGFMRIQRRLIQPWQIKSRNYNRHLGVVRFANGLIADVGSRCRLVPEHLVGNEWKPEDDPVVTSAIAGYRSHRFGTRQLIRNHVWHYQVSGECYQVLEQTDAGVEWSIRSVESVQARGGGVVLVQDIPGGSLYDGGARLVPEQYVRRLWLADEDWPLYATSPMRAIIVDCDRYWALGRRIKRDADSALIQNGIMFTPESAHEYETIGAKKISKLDRDFYDLAEEAYGDDDAMVGTAPYMMHYPTDANTPPPQWIKVGRDMDAAGIQLRQEALEAIARGTNLPQSLVVSGPGGGNHWSDWLVDEKFFTTSLAPVMDGVCHDDLTLSMLRPQLRVLASMGSWAGQPDEWRVGYDPVDVIVHPDQAAASERLYPLGLLKGAKVLEVHGFVPADAPDPTELAQIVKFFVDTRGAKPAEGAPPGGSVKNLVGPSTTPELPPTPALSALAVSPYPAEVGSWLD